jgi:hypothetical protein
VPVRGGDGDDGSCFCGGALLLSSRLRKLVVFHGDAGEGRTCAQWLATKNCPKPMRDSCSAPRPKHSLAGSQSGHQLLFLAEYCSEENIHCNSTSVLDMRAALQRSKYFLLFSSKFSMLAVNSFVS